MPSERVIWGIPGSGKTRAGITLAQNWVKRGTLPNQIAYLAFTKAAAKAASKKIFETEDEAKMTDEFPYFRTIHSLCYLGLKKQFPDLKLIQPGDMKQFSQETSFGGTYSVYDWEELSDIYAAMKDRGRTEFDAALAAYTFTRIKATSIQDLDRARLEPSKEGQAQLGLDDLSLDVYRAFVEKYERFKKRDGLIDFTDMLEFGLRDMRPLEDVRYVVLDEAQDLAPIHHALCDRVFSNSEEVWWIGDDDQTLFSFSGASAELFLERAKRAQFQIQLRETHRYGQEIVEFSKEIIERVKSRHPKEIVGMRGRSGKVLVTGAFEPVTGDVLILHRHVAGCQNLADAYIAAGLPFRNERGKDPLDSTKRIKAWKAIQALSKGEAVSVPQAAVIIEDLLPSIVNADHNTKVRLIVHGAKSKIEERMKGQVTLRDLIQAKILTAEGADVIGQREYTTMKYAEDLYYYERVTKNGYDIEKQEGIPKITTIHGSKGREAERAIVFSEMGYRCWDDPDTEHRLAYVAATRTKSDLTICMENTVHWAGSEYEYPVR